MNLHILVFYSSTFCGAASMLKLAFPPPYLKEGADFSHGANFASGGSGLLDSTGELLVSFRLPKSCKNLKKLSDKQQKLQIL